MRASTRIVNPLDGIGRLESVVMMFFEKRQVVLPDVYAWQVAEKNEVFPKNLEIFLAVYGFMSAEVCGDEAGKP
jgi:hypothetical protein